MDEKKEEAGLQLLTDAYERTSLELAEYARSVFEDFKLLAAIGAMVAWGPLEKSVFSVAAPASAREAAAKAIAAGWWVFSSEQVLLLVGFVAILVVVGAIGIRDAVKGSTIVYYVDYLAELEHEMEKRFGVIAPHGLRKWKRWHKSVHGPQQRLFRNFVAAVVLVLPVAVLASRCHFASAGIYALAFLAVVAVISRVNRKLIAARTARVAGRGAE